MLIDESQGTASPARDARPAPAGRRSMGMLAVVFGLVAGACEPTAFISSQIHDFQAIHSPGTVGSQCNETSADVRPSLRFTLTDTNQDFIFPGDRLRGFTMTLGDTFTPDELRIQGNRGVLFPAPDVLCDASASIGSACPDATLAAAGFTCQLLDPTAPTGDTQAQIACARPEFTVEIGPNAEIGFTGDTVRRKAVIVLMANGSSLLGLDATGNPDRPNCSSDPFDRRTRGLSLMLRLLSDEGNPFVGSTVMCLATFTGQSEPDYRFPDGRTLADCFQQVEQGRTGFEFLDTEIDRIGTSEEAGGRNLWGAIIDASGRFNEWLSADHERHLVVFTDGGLTEDVVETATALGQTPAAALQELVNNEVSLRVIQLDRRDRSAACTPALSRGALEELSRMACATGGTYSYVERADDLPEAFTNLGRAIPGRYDIQLVTEALATLPLGPYKLATTITATVNERQASFIFSALAGSSSSASRQDTRLALFNRGECASRTCQPGYVCDASSPTCHAPAPVTGTTTPPEGSGE